MLADSPVLRRLQQQVQQRRAGGSPSLNGGSRVADSGHSNYRPPNEPSSNGSSSSPSQGIQGRHPQVGVQRTPPAPQPAFYHHQQHQQQQFNPGQSWTSSSSIGGGGVYGNQPQKVKCVFLGDGAVGKTSLIVSYTTNGYPSEYVPTAIDTYDVVVHVDGEPVTFEMCDTPGQDDFDTLRPLVYPNTDVFLLCFSVVIPSSFHNVREKWVPEILKSMASTGSRDGAGGGRAGGPSGCCLGLGKGGSGRFSVPVVLVGTQSDLRADAQTLVNLSQYREQPVTEAEARKLAASLGCEGYIESSSLTQKNLKEVFDQAIMAGLKGHRDREASFKKAQLQAQRRQRRGGGCGAGGSCVLL